MIQDAIVEQQDTGAFSMRKLSQDTGIQIIDIVTLVAAWSASLPAHTCLYSFFGRRRTLQALGWAKYWRGNHLVLPPPAPKPTPHRKGAKQAAAGRRVEFDEANLRWQPRNWSGEADRDAT